MNNMIKNDNYGILDPLFDELFFGNKNKHEVMKTDIKDEGDHYLMKIDLPEVKKENIKLSLEDGYLIVSAKFDYNNEDKEKNNYIRRERHYGNCSRSYYLGEDVTEEEVNKLSSYLTDKYQDIEFDIKNGNQPVYSFIIGVE